MHRIDSVALQKRQQSGVLLEGLNLAGTRTGFVAVDLGLGFIKTSHKAIHALGWFNLCLFLRPVVNPGNAGFEFLQQFVVLGDLAVDVPFLRLDAPPLHLTGGNAHVDGRDFLNALTFITAVIYALRSARRLQRPISVSGPCRPPFLGVLSIVPVGGVLPMILPAAFTIRDAVALAVQIVNLPTLRPPLTIRTEGPDRQQNMSVGIAITLVMERKVGAHSSRYKIIFDE